MARHAGLATVVRQGKSLAGTTRPVVTTAAPATHLTGASASAAAKLTPRGLASSQGMDTPNGRTRSARRLQRARNHETRGWYGMQPRVWLSARPSCRYLPASMPMSAMPAATDDTRRATHESPSPAAPDRYARPPSPIAPGDRRGRSGTASSYFTPAGCWAGA